MATTIPPTFTGTPTLTAHKVTMFTEWLRDAMGNRDKADSDDYDYYDGLVEAYEHVLIALYEPVRA